MESQLHRTGGGVHEEEVHGAETKSAMQKVKAKVDKLKDTIMHGHGHGHGQKDETEAVNNTPAVRSGLMEPTVMGTPVLAEDLYATRSDIVDPPVRSFSKWQEEEKHGDPPPVSTGLYGTRLFEDENRRAASAQPVSVGSHGIRPLGKVEKDEDKGVYVAHPGGPHVYADTDLNKENIPKGATGKSSGMRVDPNAPGARTGHPANYETKVTDPTHTGGHEAVGITDVLHSFHKMSVLDTPETDSETKPFKSGKNEPSAYTGSPDQFSAKQVDNPPLDTIAADPSNKHSSYAQRVTSATSAITSKGSGVKGYLMESFKPVDDDKVLSQTITNALHRNKANTQQETITVGPGDDDAELPEVVKNALQKGEADTQQEVITTPEGETTIITTTTYVINDEEGERRLQGN